MKRLARRRLGVGAHPGHHAEPDDRDLPPGRAQEGHGSEDSAEQRQVLLAGDAQAAHLVEVPPQVRFRLARVGPAVPQDVDGEHQRRREQPGDEEAQRPGERHAQEVAQEERGVAERRQAAADVRDEEDEEDDGVSDVLPLAVRLQQGPDEEHRGARSCPTKEARSAPEAEERGVRARRRLEVALEEDPARDHEQPAQQDDERHVVRGGVDERLRAGAQVEDEHGAAQEGGDPELAQVGLPEVRGGEGKDGDREEQPREGQGPGQGGDEGFRVHESRKSTAPGTPPGRVE